MQTRVLSHCQTFDLYGGTEPRVSFGSSSAPTLELRGGRAHQLEFGVCFQRRVLAHDDMSATQATRSLVTSPAG